jgi:hypothetical protein
MIPRFLTQEVRCATPLNKPRNGYGRKDTVYLGVQVGFEPEQTQDKIIARFKELKGRFVGDWHPLSALMEEPMCDYTPTSQLVY